jgi:hypothetical protein
MQVVVVRADSIRRRAVLEVQVVEVLVVIAVREQRGLLIQVAVEAAQLTLLRQVLVGQASSLSLTSAHNVEQAAL